MPLYAITTRLNIANVRGAEERFFDSTRFDLHTKADTDKYNSGN